MTTFEPMHCFLFSTSVVDIHLLHKPKAIIRTHWNMQQNTRHACLQATCAYLLFTESAFSSAMASTQDFSATSTTHGPTLSSALLKVIRCMVGRFAVLSNLQSCSYPMPASIQPNIQQKQTLISLGKVA